MAIKKSGECKKGWTKIPFNICKKKEEEKDNEKLFEHY
jgi:hypothetical protein